ncbi:MAG: M23 family metallopeptidase [Clostridia bacterium]|nr:M23 family metallopeptidase [Clostridia bacterium]
MKIWLCLLMALCLLAAPAVGEGLDDGVTDVSAAAVDADVGEAEIGFGEDAPVPGTQQEMYAEERLPPSGADESCYLDIPNVYDLKNAVAASDRVYPGTLLWPLPGTQPLRHISSRVGWRDAARIHRGQGGEWPSWLHHGTDVSHVTTSQLVVAADDGIAYAGVQRGNGLYVVIDHGNGFYTKCQHLSRFAGAIFEGCREIPVLAGDPIGYVGNSGGDYPVHFHFEIAWSPDGPGSDDATYHAQTHNRKIYAYSFPQQSRVKLRWPETWELCSAEYQTFVTDPEMMEDEEAEWVEGWEADIYEDP